MKQGMTKFEQLRVEDRAGRLVTLAEPRSSGSNRGVFPPLVMPKDVPVVEADAVLAAIVHQYDEAEDIYLRHPGTAQGGVVKDELHVQVDGRQRDTYVKHPVYGWCLSFFYRWSVVADYPALRVALELEKRVRGEGLSIAAVLRLGLILLGFVFGIRTDEGWSELVRYLGPKSGYLQTANGEALVAGEWEFDRSAIRWEETEPGVHRMTISVLWVDPSKR